MIRSLSFYPQESRHLRDMYPVKYSTRQCDIRVQASVMGTDKLYRVFAKGAESNTVPSPVSTASGSYNPISKDYWIK